MEDQIDNPTVEGSPVEEDGPAPVVDDKVPAPEIPDAKPIATEEVKPEEVAAVVAVLEDAEAIVEDAPAGLKRDQVMAVLKEMQNAIEQISKKLEVGEPVKKVDLTDAQAEAIHAGENTRARKFLAWLDSLWE